MCVAVATATDCGSSCSTSTEVERWNGRRWSLREPPVPRRWADYALNEVACRSASYCLAIGYYEVGQGCSYGGACTQTPLIERWDGAAWHQETAPRVGRKYLSLVTVSCFRAAACALVGAGTKYQYLAQGGARGWLVRRIGRPVHAKLFSVGAVSCASRRACTVLATVTTAPDVTRPIIERWNGSRWLVSQAPTATGSSDVAIGGIACPTTGRCVAVGSLTNDDGEQVALAERWLHFHWSQQVVPDALLPVPTALNAVWCPSAASCLAVGRAEDPHSSALAYQWSGAAWSALPTPRLPTATLQGLNDISCSAAAACMGVGSVFQSANSPVAAPMAEVWEGSQWQTQAISPPVGAATSFLSGVSCASAVACIAVGGASSQTSGGNSDPLVERWDGSSWLVEAAPSPAGAASSALAGISCISEGTCQAVGDYEDAANRQTPLVEGRSGAVWGLESVPLPTGTATGQLISVSCVSIDWCVGVGSAADSPGKNVAFVVAWTGSGWNTAPVATPAGAAGSGLNAISCVSRDACTAVGSYTDTAGNENPLVVRWNGSAWNVDPGPTVPAGTELDGVSCALDGSCTVVGYYFTTYPNGSSQPAPVSAQLS